MRISHSNNSNNRRLFSSLSKQAATQSADFSPKNRWLAVPPANLVHLSIGGVYVYTMWTPAMTQTLGVVSTAYPSIVRQFHWEQHTFYVRS